MAASASDVWLFTVVMDRKIVGRIRSHLDGARSPGATTDSDVDEVPPRSLARRIAYAISIGFVTLVAAWNSYWHMAAVAQRGHQEPILAYSLPFSVDGMLLVSALAIAEDKANGRRARGWARFAFWLGAVVSIAANIASVVVHYGWDILSIAVSAWPPVALLVVVEIMAKPGRPKTTLVGPVTAAGPAPAPPDTPDMATIAAPASVPVEAGNGGNPLDPADVAAVADMIAPAREAAAELTEQGRPVSRETLTEKLRERGHAMSNARASALVKIVRAGTPT